MFTKILIANRGEIACRIIATCRKLGVRTVAVYSEADANARHVRLADEAYCIGPAASRESYLRIERIIEVCQQSGAQAVHPGYGFLSENEAFASACEANGLVFIGPPVSSIRAMGSKSAAKALMERAGVPLVPGYHGDDQDPELLRKQADRIGYPVLIKASAGGGGKGMRVVNSSDEFAANLQSCQREARASFGDDRVLVEKYLQQPRHIEIQVFADRHGNTLSLHERDCSAQRRHQKVVEEAPAPGLTPAQREAMGRAACDAARAVGYVGAGTVEFIADGQDPGRFYFMEMNTRLQVEHPVTEMITGLDLVEWQLRVASGEPLPLKQEEIPLRGHSIEVRLYAEEPEKGFLPSIGKLVCFTAPQTGPHVRLDTGVETGDDVTPHYDPMLAKLIVWDHSREAAIERMLAALADMRVVGVGHNIAFLSRLVGHPRFRDGRIDTGLIEREREVLLPPPSAPSDEVLQVAALSRLADERSVASDSPWSISDGWRINSQLTRRFEFAVGDEKRTVELVHAGDAFRLGDEVARVSRLTDRRYRVSIGDRRVEADVIPLREELHVFLRGRHDVVTLVDPLAHAGEVDDAHGGLNAPMPGKIVALLVAPGTTVAKGDALLVMEAMKMEITVCAQTPGKVVSFSYAEGDQVTEGTSLIEFEGAEA